MSHLGLIATFRENQAFAIWFQLTLALPLLPEADIVTAWNELKSMPVPEVPVVKFRVSN